MRSAKLLRLVLMALAVWAIPAVSQAQIAVGVAIHIGPPALPVYVQPVCPGPGYLWTPGYWAYGPDGYYWVPGTWVEPPTVGLLWTPGYWGWGGGIYAWHAGYWGPHVGFYGGINYGFGYGGVGFAGGEWRGGVFAYNRAVTNVNVTVIHNTYNTTVVNNNTTVNRVSFNGGNGGITARPTGAELAAEREGHTPATAMQTQHEHLASGNHALLASVNHGSPAVAATAKPGVFKGEGVVAARAGRTNENRPPNKGTNAINNRVSHDNRPPNAGGNRTGSTQNAKTAANRPNTKSQESNRAHGNSAHPPQTHANRPPEGGKHQGSEHPGGERPGGEHPGKPLR